MNNIELLEFAAKAAGIQLQLSLGSASGDLVFFIANGNVWNPLEDDGDALRLAVKLELRISTHCNHEAAHASDIHGREGVHINPVPWAGDPYAATRRAIVRAAAEIGRGVK